MKLLHFCNLCPVKQGAYEHLLTEIARVFRTAGDTLVLAFAGEPSPSVADALRDAGARWHAIEGWSDGAGGEHPWRFVGPALRLLRAERPDVATVHFGNELPSLAVLWLARLSGVRGVQWVWEQDQQIAAPSALTRHVSRIRALRLGFAQWLAVYDGGRDSLVARGIPASRIAVVYNAVRDHAQAHPHGWLREALGLAPETVCIANVGWHVPRKRILFVLDRLAQLAGDTSLPPWAFVQVGAGPGAAQSQARATALGLGDRCRFLGLRDDVRDVLAECDLLVHASLAETCTYVISESMCAGIPAVVTEAGAAREQIVDGESGYVVAPGDATGLEQGLARLVRDAALRARMGQAARARWAERYRVEVAASALHAMYRRVAARPRRVRSWFLVDCVGTGSCPRRDGRDV